MLSDEGVRTQEVGALARRAGRRLRDERRAMQVKDDPEPSCDSPTSLGLAIVLAAVCVVLTAWNLSGRGPSAVAVAAAAPADMHQELREWLFSEVLEIEAFRERSGRVPMTLAELGYAEDADLVYKRFAADHYRVTTRDGARSTSYDSTESLNRAFPEQLED